MHVCRFAYCLPVPYHAEEPSKEADISTECLLGEGDAGRLPQAAGYCSTGEKGFTLERDSRSLGSGEEPAGSTQSLGVKSAALESSANSKREDSASPHSEVNKEPSDLAAEDTIPLSVPSTSPQSHSRDDIVHTTPGEPRPAILHFYMSLI